MLPSMARSPGRGLFIAYVVVAALMGPMMFFSAIMKLKQNPGAVHTIHEVVGVPLSLFPLLAVCEIAGGLGLLVGIFRPKLGIAAAAGLVVYFLGAMIGHVLVSDWAGLKAPITPMLLSIAALVLRISSVKRAARTAPQGPARGRPRCLRRVHKRSEDCRS